MFSPLKTAFHKINEIESKKETTKDILWIKLILELFSEIHQIDHDLNKLFWWLLSECKSLYDDTKNKETYVDTNQLEMYLNALLAALHIAIERKQSELKGLEILQQICLSIITSPKCNKNNQDLNTIALRIVEYLCRHTDNVWILCSEFAVFELNKHCTTAASDHQIVQFQQLCEFVLMLLKTAKSSKSSKSVEWISNIHSLCCKLICNNPYLKVLCKTIFFHIYGNHTHAHLDSEHTFVHQKLLYAFSKEVLCSINQQQSNVSIQHFILLQWSAHIIFTQEHVEVNAVMAKQYRNCILCGLKSGIKGMEQISIQLLGKQEYHKYILAPLQLSKECIDSICVLYNIMYETRANTISNILTRKLTKVLQLLPIGTNDTTTQHTVDVMCWIQSILHVIWAKGLKHRNKAVRRITMYALLSWDFQHKSAPFNQSFILNELLSLLNQPLWFRRSYYDITKTINNKSNKSEEALNTKAPPEGFGFLIESFLTHYVFQCIQDPFAQQMFLSEFIVCVSTKSTSFYALYHIFGFLAEIHKHHDDDDDESLRIITAQNLKEFQRMIENLLPKFAPLYNKKLVPLICAFISFHLDTKIEFYGVSRLIHAIPKQYVSPTLNNTGFVYLRHNLNKQDWIGMQLLALIQQYMTKPESWSVIKIDVITNVLQYVAYTESYQNIINILFEVVSVSYSQPYKSEPIVQFCMQLLSVIIDLCENENYLEFFVKHRRILRERMHESNCLDEIISYVFEEALHKVDFSEHQNWILDLSHNLMQYYAHSSSVHSWMIGKLNKIYLHYTQITQLQQYYVMEDFPSLFLWSICIKYHYKLMKESRNENEMEDALLSLWIAIQVNPNLYKTHCETLQMIQFNAILGIVSEKDGVISKNIARNVIQFGVHSLDTAQSSVKASILECISLLLPFAELSTSNLNVVSTSALHLLQDTNYHTSVADSYCVDLILFPVLFKDKRLHDAPGGVIRKQLFKAVQTKKSCLLQPIISGAFLLWYSHPNIAVLYVDHIVAMTHTMYNTKIFDPEDRINREEYLFAALLMFLSVMFQQTTKEYQQFKSLFISKLFEMMDKECEVPYLDTIHQKTWNIFWHCSQFITNEYGFNDDEIKTILQFLCDLCYNIDRAISSNQRQWITLSIIRIIVVGPKHIHHLYKKYEIIGRKPNTYVWLMYALGDTANKLVHKYQSQPISISKDFLIDILQRVIAILTPHLSNNYGLVRTTTQYFFYQLMQHYISIDAHHNLGDAIMAIYKDLKETPDSIKLRKRLKTSYEWLEQYEIKIDDQKQDDCTDALQQQLQISRDKARKETQNLQDNIIKSIVSQHPMLQNKTQMVNEIIHLIKNRVGLVSFTDHLSDALSSILLSTFEYYSASKPMDNESKGNDYKELMRYQRKLDPLMMGYNKCVETEQLKLIQDIKANRRKCFGEVIVVASLLDKATNLGGICRTCEIFGVKQMIIHDKRLLKREEFQRLSVTSEQWLPIEQVHRRNLITYLRKRKETENYFIIGLEQTTNSVLLNEIEFIGAQSKCIIVIGTEKTGLPPNIINECDICVEIPQFGVIRSLNAHVSFAIILWEYIKQQLKQRQN